MRTELVALAVLVGCASSAVAGSIGVVARRDGLGRVVIVEVPAGEAGARAGLEVGDEVLAIDGVDVRDLDREGFQRLARGAVGSRVSLEVRRDGLRHRIFVERRALHAPGAR